MGEFFARLTVSGMALVFGMIGGMAWADPSAVRAGIWIFDQKVTLQSPAIVSQEHLYVPLRDIAAVLNLDVVYDARVDEYSVKREKDLRHMVFAVGAREVMVNERKSVMAVPSIEYQKRIYVPLGEFCWQFGLAMRHNSQGSYYVSQRLLDVRQEADHVVIQTGSPVEPEISYREDLGQLVVDLPHTILAGANRSSEGKAPVLKLTLAQNQLLPDRTRVGIRLSKYEGHHSVVDEGNNRVSIYFGTAPAALPQAAPAA